MSLQFYVVKRYFKWLSYFFQEILWIPLSLIQFSLIQMHLRIKKPTAAKQIRSNHQYWFCRHIYMYSLLSWNRYSGWRHCTVVRRHQAQLGIIHTLHDASARKTSLPMPTLSLHFHEPGHGSSPPISEITSVRLWTYRNIYQTKKPWHKHARSLHTRCGTPIIKSSPGQLAHPYFTMSIHLKTHWTKNNMSEKYSWGG